jgi:hypothetical protein
MSFEKQSYYSTVGPANLSLLGEPIILQKIAYNNASCKKEHLSDTESFADTESVADTESFADSESFVDTETFADTDSDPEHFQGFFSKMKDKAKNAAKGTVGMVGKVAKGGVGLLGKAAKGIGGGAMFLINQMLGRLLGVGPENMPYVWYGLSALITLGLIYKIYGYVRMFF